MRLPEVELGSDRDDAGRVQLGQVEVVAANEVVEVHRRGDARGLVEVAEVGPEVVVVDQAPAVTIGVAVVDLDQAIAAATARGGSVEMPPTDNGWVVKAQVRDPAGNLLTLIAR